MIRAWHTMANTLSLKALYRAEANTPVVVADRLYRVCPAMTCDKRESEASLARPLSAIGCANESDMLRKSMSVVQS